MTSNPIRNSMTISPHLFSYSKDLAVAYKLGRKISRGLNLPSSINGEKTYQLIGRAILTHSNRAPFKINHKTLEPKSGFSEDICRNVLWNRIKGSLGNSINIDSKKGEFDRLFNEVVILRTRRSFDYHPILRMRALRDINYGTISYSIFDVLPQIFKDPDSSFYNQGDDLPTTFAGRKRYFISDLHMGDGSARDDFKKLKEIMEFIRREVAANPENVLFINGDLFEAWQCKVDDIVREYREFFEELIEITNDVIIINGNHDEFSKKLWGKKIEKPHSTDHDGRKRGIYFVDRYVDKFDKLIILHGAGPQKKKSCLPAGMVKVEADPANTSHIWIGRTISRIGGWLESLGYSKIDDWFNKIQLDVFPTERKIFMDVLRYFIFMKQIVVEEKKTVSDEEEIEKDGLEEHQKYGVIFGHTHKVFRMFSETPFFVRYGILLDNLFKSAAFFHLNSGTWTNTEDEVRNNVIVMEPNRDNTVYNWIFDDGKWKLKSFQEVTPEEIAKVCDTIEPDILAKIITEETETSQIV
jgi:UDP-2,3-diacylglucosamine pyrophosphatase LpxH